MRLALAMFGPTYCFLHHSLFCRRCKVELAFSSLFSCCLSPFFHIVCKRSCPWGWGSYIHFLCKHKCRFQRGDRSFSKLEPLPRFLKKDHLRLPNKSILLSESTLVSYYFLFKCQCFYIPTKKV